jgi:hypothetical protein
MAGASPSACKKRRPTGVRQFRHRMFVASVLALVALAALVARADLAADERLDGFNILAVADRPFGSLAATASLAQAKRVGARAIAIIPFFWQPVPASPNLIRDVEMSDVELRAAIRDAHEFGLAALVKPHVAVPDAWAGAVAMTSEDDWRRWFAAYRVALNRIARIAAEEKADALVIGTELSATEQRPEWNVLIEAARALYPGRLLYIAHNVEDAEKVPFWDRLDAIGVTLYPSLGADADREGRRTTMRAVAERLDLLAARYEKQILVGEIGLRSAAGTAAKPWESMAERPSTPDPELQAAVIADWLDALDRPAVGGVLVWNWLTDPGAGGLEDTDFTVQGKPAEKMLACTWARQCARAQAIVRFP